MDPKAELTLQFLNLADDDLQLSELIIGEAEPVRWAAAFHAQQCAEKSLKGLLTYNNIRAGKTHDIGGLIKLGLPVHHDLEKFKERANRLTAYAVDSRYPMPHTDISEQEATEAIETARMIYEFVLNCLPNLAKDC